MPLDTDRFPRHSRKAPRNDNTWRQVLSDERSLYEYDDDTYSGAVPPVTSSGRLNSSLQVIEADMTSLYLDENDDDDDDDDDRLIQAASLAFVQSVSFDPYNAGVPLCRTDGCSNYGNVRCRGYCNACYNARGSR